MQRLWVMGAKSLRTNLVERKLCGFSQVWVMTGSTVEILSSSVVYIMRTS